MRGLILVVMLAGVARAGDFAQPVIDGVTSTDTVRGIDISSAPATDIIISTAPLYRQACVQNLDTSAFLVCSENVNVSTQTASNLVGVIVPPAATASQPQTPLCFSVVPGQRWYCETSSVTGTTRAVISRGR